MANARNIFYLPAVLPGAFWKPCIWLYICTCLIPETLSHKMEQAFGDLEEESGLWLQLSKTMQRQGNAEPGWKWAQQTFFQKEGEAAAAVWCHPFWLRSGKPLWKCYQAACLVTLSSLNPGNLGPITAGVHSTLQGSQAGSLAACFIHGCTLGHALLWGSAYSRFRGLFFSTRQHEILVKFY